MSDKIRELLEEEIETEFQNISSLDFGSDEYSTALEGLVKLYKLKIEEDKNGADFEEKKERRLLEETQHKEDAEFKTSQNNKDFQLRERQLNNDVSVQERDEKFKRSQLAEQIKDRYFRLGIETIGIILPLMFYASWMRKGFKFEETGTYTSTTFRGLFNRFKPTKK